MSNSSWRQNIIRDGFTQDGFIAESEGLHGELRFKFRPMLPEEYELLELFRQSNPGDPRRVGAKEREEIASRLKAWSEVDNTNTSVPINADVLKMLRPELWYKLLAVVIGQRRTDDDPKSKGLDDKNLSEQLGN